MQGASCGKGVEDAAIQSSDVEKYGLRCDHSAEKPDISLHPMIGQYREHLENEKTDDDYLH